MLPIESGKGQIWVDDQFFCDVDYEIKAPQKIAAKLTIQLLRLTRVEDTSTPLPASGQFALVLAVGEKYPIPRPLRNEENGQLLCYLEVIE